MSTTSPFVGNQSINTASYQRAQITSGGPPRELNLASLSPEGLMIFCQTQLRDLDEKIQGGMASQKKMVDLQNKIGVLKSDLAHVGLVGEAHITMSQEQKDSLNGKFDEAYAMAQSLGNQEAMTAIKNAKDAFNLGGDLEAGEKETKVIMDALDSAAGSARSGAELQMIELQGLMSKRATALQLTTNMLNSMNESLKNIAGNVGR
jgi:hypothetical protein